MTVKVGDTPPHELPPWTTLAEAKAWVDEHMGSGVLCPTCTQKVKLYPRHLTNTHVRVLTEMYRVNGTDWVNVPKLARERLSDVAHSGGNLTWPHFWGLIQKAPHTRGEWKLTDLGLAWLQGRHTVPEVAVTYKGETQYYLGGSVDVHDANGTRFLLENALAAVPR